MKTNHQEFTSSFTIIPADGEQPCQQEPPNRILAEQPGNTMGRFSRAQAWAFPNMLNRLPEHYYRHRTELQKPSTRVHDRPPETDFFDLKYNDRVKRV